MTPTALIAEDEPLLAAALQAELAACWPELRIVATVGDGAGAVAQTLHLKPDVCFLDIRMPGQTGLEAAQALAEDWPNELPLPLLVFVTAYDQYALAAFDAQAVDYLVKPVQPQRLAACVARLQAHLGARQRPAPGQPQAELEATLNQLRQLLRARDVIGPAPGAAPACRLEFIPASVGAVVHMVPVSEVIYFEAADKYLRVVTHDREHLIRLSIKELLPQLDAQVFWQVHRSLVVRAASIATAQRDDSGKVALTLRGRTERLSASRLYAHLFRGL